MTIKASGRSVSIFSGLILATGLFVCFAGPLPAAAGADDNAAADSQADSQSATSEPDAAAAEPAKHQKRIRHASRHWISYAHHKSGKVALKSSPAKKTDATDGAADGDVSTEIPPSVANANAQLPTVDTPDSNARTMTARANDMLQAAAQDIPQAAAEKPADAQPAAETQVLAPDQLNDVDRTLPASTASAPAPAMTSADAPAQAMAAADSPDEPVVTNSDDSSSVDRTSLIGKIFMACGGVLTLASAVRMFIG
jgi:hypothetical protein